MEVQMTTKNKIIFALFLGTGCTVENNLKDLVPHIPGGECNMDDLQTGSEMFRPIAVCSSSDNNVPPIRSSVDFFGDQSYDPNDLDLVGYYWKLVERPQGSSVLVGEHNANNYDFVPDIAGRYVMELVVVNEACIQSDPCQVELEAVPDADFWVEMFWQFPDDDMDLHLIQNDSPYLSDGDCYYGNCVSFDDWSALDWGGPGTEDDPNLDLDDISGVGPENINIQSPAEGSYRVVVHDYPGSERWDANEVTVRIHISGEIVYEETKRIEGEDQYVPFAEINWPGGSVNPL
jgi:hypothetical protein